MRVSVEGGVHVADIAVGDAVEGAAGCRAPPGRPRSGARTRAGRRARSVATDAVAQPALHRAACGRTFILFAGPFVVAAGHFVEHARADAPDPSPRGVEEEVDDGREREPGAGAFPALVQNFGDERAIDQDVRQRAATAGRGSRGDRSGPAPRRAGGRSSRRRASNPRMGGGWPPPAAWSWGPNGRYRRGWTGSGVSDAGPWLLSPGAAMVAAAEAPAAERRSGRPHADGSAGV